MSIRSQRGRSQPIYDVPTMPPWPPSYDSIYTSSDPYIPVRLTGGKSMQSELSPRHREGANVVGQALARSRRSYAGGNPRLEETSFVQYSDRSSVHSIDPSRVNYEFDTQQVKTQRRKPNDVLCIRMVPGEGGRYGFRVRGGADLHRPITVGRVIPLGPADICDPKLQSGDQILFINGVEVSNSTHEEVVKLIRSSHKDVGELFLVVKRKDSHDNSTTSSFYTNAMDAQRRPTSNIVQDPTDVQCHFLGDY